MKQLQWKVEKIKNPAIFSWSAGTYYLIMAISGGKNPLKFGYFDAFFSQNSYA
jgi:hypothetical protein